MLIREGRGSGGFHCIDRSGASAVLTICDRFCDCRKAESEGTTPPLQCCACDGLVRADDPLRFYDNGG